MGVHDRDDFDVTSNSVRYNVGNMGLHDFARALMRTTTSRGRQVSEHVHRRHDPRDDTRICIRIVILDVCADIIKTQQGS
ncbi:hypothetical protein AX760_24080 [Pararhizobium antarcticum]|uniref:Uncharacterized protein n=1 Tax=Pararhizobium antarcticum TaxID=1798805 RepID=A0A657LM13_9HYPH|nr:hypothetical protein AX760_24080 [Pararhizobium antarcticum]OJF99475.1 hypothetical protein AX761_10840 [Rhizobium sp. 58]